MSTCRDCFHYDVCLENAKEELKSAGLNIDLDNLPLPLNKCEFFKDKSKIVELPCKVGDTLFFIDEIIELQGRKKVRYEIGEECIVDNIKIGQQMIPYVNACTKDNRWIMFCADDFGKTVFTSKKEAEKALNKQKD